MHGRRRGLKHVVRSADLRTFSRSYHQRGIVASVRTQQANDTAWQRFLPTGPLALLPVRDGYSNIVWSTSVQQAMALEKASPQEFALAVNEVRHCSHFYDCRAAWESFRSPISLVASNCMMLCKHLSQTCSIAQTICLIIHGVFYM